VSFALYLTSVFTIALPLALFEIWLERFKTGWGGNFTSEFWGRKIQFGLAKKLLGSGVELGTRYHILMFPVVVPTLFFLCARFLGRHVAHAPVFWPLFVIAGMLGIMLVEDVLWFVLNAAFHLRFPDALQRLLRGDVSWHPRWIRLGSVKLPDFYVWMPVLVTALLYLQAQIAK